MCIHVCMCAVHCVKLYKIIIIVIIIIMNADF